MAKRSASSDKIKRIALIVLGAALVFVVIYQVFLKGSEPRTRRTPQAGKTTDGTQPQVSRQTAPVQQVRQQSAAAQQEALLQAQLSDLTPLNLASISSAAKGSPVAPNSRGNIFAFYVEPPQPPAPPPPPPPIQLVSVQPQSVVAGTPRPVKLIVSGNKIPADAQIIFNGNPRPTKRVTETQLSTDIPPGDYAYEQSITVQVKSQSDPTQNSNSIPFVVQKLQEPQFIYKGRLGALNQPQYNYAVFELTTTKEIKRAKVGETIMGVWRIDAITADAVEITQTQYDIKRRVPLQDKPR